MEKRKKERKKERKKKKKVKKKKENRKKERKNERKTKEIKQTQTLWRLTFPVFSNLKMSCFLLVWLSIKVHENIICAQSV